MNIKYVLFILLAIIIPVNSYSLGFGPIHVFSKLNEPLNIEFQLIDSKGINTDDIIIKNASTLTYQQAGLFRAAEFNRVKFIPVKRTDGSIVIKVTSKKSFRELYVTFIADLSWKNIHLNREYTFFLDPVNFAPQKTSKKKIVSAKNRKPLSTAKKNNRTYPRKAITPGSAYTVQRGDSLSKISRRARPDKSVSLRQTMNTIFALNPKAFINNNIDLIKQGYTITLPDKEEILQYNNQAVKVDTTKKKTPSTAKSAILKKEEPSSSEAAIVNTAKEKTITTAPTTHRLKIVPPSEDLLNRPVDDDVVELMTKTLKTSHETITLLKKENSLLSERIEKLTQKLDNFDDQNKELSDKIDHINRLLEQNKSIPAPKSVAKTVEKVTTETAIKAPTKTQISIKSPVIKQEEKKQSMLQQISTAQNLLIILLIVIFVLLIIIYMIKKQLKKTHKLNSSNNLQEFLQTEESTPAQKNDIDNDTKIANYFDNSALAANTAVKSVVSQDTPEISHDVPDITPKTPEPETKVIDSFADATEIELDLDFGQAIDETSPSTDSSHDTILRDVNTFMAYGKHDSAEHLLLDELDKAPDEKLLHIRLFELYAETSDINKFKQHMKKVNELSSNDAEFLAKIDNIYLNTWK